MIKFAFNPSRILLRKTLGRYLRQPDFSYEEVIRGEVWACTDLGAYQRPLQNLKGIAGVVIMEDRFPNFFLSYDHFEAERTARLNRHGPLSAYETLANLKTLVRALHEQNLKIVIGFWNFYGWPWHLFHRPKWFRAHQELKPVRASSDIDPFVNLQKEKSSYGAYIANQYQKLHRDFGFDGLFLGDGFSGYRTIRDPGAYRDKAYTAPQWQELYREIAKGVKRTNGLLFAYDCLGLSYEDAKLHGADYKLFSEAGLDYLVYQSYPQAWGDYWLSNFKDDFNLEANTRNIKSVADALRGTTTKILYSLELGDTVEGWRANPEKTKAQMTALDPFVQGRFLVWANELFAKQE